MKFYIFFLLLTIGCTNYPKTSSNIVGKFISLSEKGSNHCIIFNNDSSYIHLLIDEYTSDTLKKGIGKWKLVDNIGSISLTNWTRYDDKLYQMVTSNRPTRASLRISNNILYVSGDDYRKNFKKE